MTLILGARGALTASLGDWAVRGIEGEFYPVKPKIFEATYQPFLEGMGEHIWWCETHDDARFRSAYNTVLSTTCSFAQTFRPDTACQMIKVSLLPLGAGDG